MTRVHPIHPVRRLDEIRALDPYVTYHSLSSWFDSLDLAPIDDGPTRRRAVSESGTPYDVSIRVGYKAAGVSLTAVGGDHEVHFKGRRYSSAELGASGQPIWTPRDLHLLKDGALAWRQNSTANLDLIPRGFYTPTLHYEPPIISVELAGETPRLPFDVVTAERLVLDAATTLVTARQSTPTTSG